MQYATHRRVSAGLTRVHRVTKRAEGLSRLVSRMPTSGQSGCNSGTCPIEEPGRQSPSVGPNLVPAHIRLGAGQALCLHAVMVQAQSLSIIGRVGEVLRVKMSGGLTGRQDLWNVWYCDGVSDPRQRTCHPVSPGEQAADGR